MSSLFWVTVPLRGGGCFEAIRSHLAPDIRLPSPCGVGVVSAIVYNISAEWSTVFVQL